MCTHAGRLVSVVFVAMLLAGCSATSQKKWPVATPQVHVERENSNPAAADMSPAQRDQAYRNAYGEGDHLVKQGQYGLAIGAFETALDLRPDSTEALFNLGACHESIGDPLRAVNLYTRVLDAKPDDADCYRNLGTSFMKLYYRDKSPAWRKMAEEAWRHSLRINADQPDVAAFLDHRAALD